MRMLLLVTPDTKWKIISRHRFAFLYVSSVMYLELNYFMNSVYTFSRSTISMKRREYSFYLKSSGVMMTMLRTHSRHNSILQSDSMFSKLSSPF